MWTMGAVEISFIIIISLHRHVKYTEKPTVEQIRFTHNQPSVIHMFAKIFMWRVKFVKAADDPHSLSLVLQHIWRRKFRNTNSLQQRLDVDLHRNPFLFFYALICNLEERRAEQRETHLRTRAPKAERITPFSNSWTFRSFQFWFSILRKLWCHQRIPHTIGSIHACSLSAPISSIRLLSSIHAKFNPINLLSRPPSNSCF